MSNCLSNFLLLYILAFGYPKLDDRLAVRLANLMCCIHHFRSLYCSSTAPSEPSLLRFIKEIPIWEYSEASAAI